MLLQAQPDGKMLAVATAMRQALEQAGQERFLRPLLTSFAVCNDLEGALALLKVVQELQMAREGLLLVCCCIGRSKAASHSAEHVRPWSSARKQQKGRRQAAATWTEWDWRPLSRVVACGTADTVHGRQSPAGSSLQHAGR